MSLPWIALIIAGFFEIGWPLGLKKGYTEDGLQWGWIALGVISMTISGILLFYAQRTIPMGTAYAVWTGIGAAGTFLVGVYFLGDPANMLRFLSVFLIIAGVIGLKMT